MLAHMLRRFAAEESGATAIEYALLGTLVGVALLATFSMVGNSLVNMFGGGTGGAAAAMDQAGNTL